MTELEEKAWQAGDLAAAQLEQDAKELQEAASKYTNAAMVKLAQAAMVRSAINSWRNTLT